MAAAGAGTAAGGLEVLSMVREWGLVGVADGCCFNSGEPRRRAACSSLKSSLPEPSLTALWCARGAVRHSEVDVHPCRTRTCEEHDEGCCGRRYLSRKENRASMSLRSASKPRVRMASRNCDQHGSRESAAMAGRL